MNTLAQKKARQAELEDYLLHVFYKADKGNFGYFVQWLEYKATGDSWHKEEAEELIALYEGLA